MDPSSSSSPSIKYDWYQTDSRIVITILIKNVSQENFTIKFKETAVSVGIKLPNDETYNLNLNLLHVVNTNQCSYKILSSKIEIYLVKNLAVRWESLEQKESAEKPKSGDKNWDALAKQMVDEKDSESVETLFSKIYSDGTDDQKRAMLKSFYESGGTVLSTNWNEVGKSTVEVKPPEGVEYKPWK
ncbi:protein SGT1 homolog isoform X4 [Planococcus citri]|uniref:protein SGT1 homolog isoform X4 n=1 Tax=Planococcus citri TaxID=170843 RepID=UPI0031F9C319